MKGVWLTLASQASQQHRQPEPWPWGTGKLPCERTLISDLSLQSQVQAGRPCADLWGKEVWVPSSPSFPGWHLPLPVLLVLQSPCVQTGGGLCELSHVVLK